MQTKTIRSCTHKSEEVWIRIFHSKWLCNQWDFVIYLISISYFHDKKNTKLTFFFVKFSLLRSLPTVCSTLVRTFIHFRFIDIVDRKKVKQNFYDRDLSNDIVVNNNNLPNGIWDDSDVSVFYPDLQETENYQPYQQCTYILTWNYFLLSWALLLFVMRINLIQQ